MPPKQSDKKSSIQTHSADAFEHAPFDRDEHLKCAREKKQERAGKMRGIVAYQMQLKQSNVQLQGPQHLKAAIEQHASKLSSVVTKVHGAGTWKPDPAFQPKAPAKKRKQVERRPMHQAQWQLQTAKRFKPVLLSQRSDPILQLHIDAGPYDAYDFYQQTLENMVLGAETVSTITAPIEPMPRERSSACVQLLDVACLLEPGDERSRIYVEHLCAADLDQHDGPAFGESTAIAYNGVRHLEKSFHTSGVKNAKKTLDPLIEDAVSIELGYSVMAGGSELQMVAWMKGEAFELRATEKAPELNAHAQVAAQLAWEHLMRRFPKTGEKMLAEVGRYGIYVRQPNHCAFGQQLWRGRSGRVQLAQFAWRPSRHDIIRWERGGRS